MKKKVGLLILVAFISLFAFNMNVSADVTCAAIPDAVIDDRIPKLTSTIINIIWIAVPVILVILGMMDLLKGVAAQKEDEIKKGQQVLIKRVIAAVIVFFVVPIVKLVIGLVADDQNIVGCLNCFVEGPSACQAISPADNTNSNGTSNQQGSI